MSEKILGIIRVIGTEERKLVNELLFFTPDRMVVARTNGGRTALSVGISYGGTVGAVIGILATLAMRKGIIESFIIGCVCGAGGAGFGAAIGAIIDKTRRKEKKEQTPEELLKAENNFDMLYSEITKVELKKKWSGGLEIKMELIDEEIEGETYWGKWVATDIPEKKKATIEDYENILRPIFGDKLSVKK